MLNGTFTNHFTLDATIIMSLSNAQVVDAAGIDKATGEIVLTIADELDWSSESEHLSLLQRKINRYLDFADGKDLFDTYPDAVSRAVRIDVIFKNPVPATAKPFLSKAENAVRKNGHSFTWRVHSV